MDTDRDESGGTAARADLIDRLRRESIADEAVVGALSRVPREAFVPADQRSNAYADHPLPIGCGQTISQPSLVAAMTSALGVSSGARVLEIGTGSGYQAAVLAELGCRVYSVEYVSELAARARATLRQCGYADVEIRLGNGWLGWPEAAPFDAIVITAAPERAPLELLDQLRPAGRMIVPVGPQGASQALTRITRVGSGAPTTTDLGAVRFVPMVGTPDPSGASG